MSHTTRAEVDVSVVCPVGWRAGDLLAVHEAFRAALAPTGRSAEFLYILDGPALAAEEALRRIDGSAYPVRVLRTSRGFGEAAILQFGFEQARGRHVLTIPDRFQADPGAVPEILRRLEAGADVVVTRREPRRDAWLNRLQSSAFHGLVRRLSGTDFRDLTCGLRGLTRDAAVRLDLYGDLHRFIPVLATRLGFTVEEIPVGQLADDRALRVFGPGIYARRLLDILNVFFLTRFVQKPLRFFGLAGMVVGGLGFAICAGLAFWKLTFGLALANRPLLLLGVLLLVLGVQVTSIGLIGEIIIFLTSRKDVPSVEEVSGPDE